jgi:hypothetical protein
MQYATLTVRAEEGKVNLSMDFKTANPVFQIDYLNDWIYELQKIRDALLAQERPDVRAALWGDADD